MSTNTLPKIIDLTTSASYASDVAAGQSAYFEVGLRWGYDLVVHGISNHLFWRVPTKRLLRLYEQHLSPNHLDVGVGIGSLLSWSRTRAADAAITLADLNPDSLRVTSQRLSSKFPRQTLYRWNALEPLPISSRFDSVGLMYLLHCLPGTMATKGVVFKHLREVMKPGAVLFGATLLGEGLLEEYLPARALASFYNRTGIFSNHGDTRAGLEDALRQAFPSVTIEITGGAALFVARSAKA